MAFTNAQFLMIGAAFMMAVAIVNALSIYSDQASAGAPIALSHALIQQFTSVLALFVLLPPVMLLVARTATGRTPLSVMIAVHVVAAAAFSLIHVLSMGGLRWAAFKGLGETYSALAPVENWLYEFRKDVLVYAGVAALYWAFGALSERRLERAQTDAIEVRDGARRYFVRPSEILWAGSAANYVELHLAGLSLLHRSALSTLESQLLEHGFIRIHRSRLINRAEMIAIEATPAGDFQVRLRNGQLVSGSRRYRAGLTAA